MLKEVIIFVFALVGCQADSPAPSQGVYCGFMPKNLLTCMGMPSLIGEDVIRRCSSSKGPCDKYTCLFTQSGWLKGGQVDKKKVSSYFDTFAASHPSWTGAITHMKAACLGDKTLPAQGVLINCPAYDTMHCALTSFVKNVSPSQWNPSAECQTTRDYAGACPVCPDDCFSSQVPNDSCHACYALPRSA